ncbi:hypothetical protein, partial [Candidatus Solincola tengchongensis]|uniref:hypothetical protein n=1 Tax=Candidatus Solincola tengchongensis TaxID=2900693 RepID=UPI00257AF6CB
PHNVFLDNPIRNIPRAQELMAYVPSCPFALGLRYRRKTSVICPLLRMEGVELYPGERKFTEDCGLY